MQCSLEGSTIANPLSEALHLEASSICTALRLWIRGKERPRADQKHYNKLPPELAAKQGHYIPHTEPHVAQAVLQGF
jgi:hypothetical protein